MTDGGLPPREGAEGDDSAVTNALLRAARRVTYDAAVGERIAGDDNVSGRDRMRAAASARVEREDEVVLLTLAGDLALMRRVAAVGTVLRANAAAIAALTAADADPAILHHAAAWLTASAGWRSAAGVEDEHTHAFRAGARALSALTGALVLPTHVAGPADAPPAPPSPNPPC